MRSPESFDAFYAANRDRLLHEAYAQTGDIAASRAAVRDAFTVAWHHWRTVAVLEDREEWLRPATHGRARRRASTRLWHRDKSLEPEVRATLDAMSKLSSSQRQLLVLTTLSPLSMTQIARVAGLTRAEAEKRLQTATAQFALHRDVPTVAIRGLLDDLRRPLGEVRWPRAPIVRRAGTARRRLHTLVGAGLAAAVMVGAGSLVTGGAGARTSSLAEGTATPGITVSPVVADSPTAEPLTDTDLLDDTQVARFGPRLAWTRSETPAGPLVLPCQRDPEADPDQTSTLVRAWEGEAPAKGKSPTRTQSSALQVVARSADATKATEAFTITKNWFAGCADPRTQLLDTRIVNGVGDEAVQFRLRQWGKKPGLLTVGVARTGSIVVATAVDTTDGAVSDKAAETGLAAAVNRLCGTAGAATCAGPPDSTEVDPVAAGATVGMLSIMDLPPTARVKGPWVGLDAERTDANLAATRCDRTSFGEKGIRRPLSRSFLFPQTKAERLGLIQTVATASNGKRARRFIDDVRRRTRSCGAANLGTDVIALEARSTGSQEVYSWVLEIELNDQQTIPYLMSVQRDGNVVSQITFTPDGPRAVARKDFVALADRALQRLSDLQGHTR